MTDPSLLAALLLGLLGGSHCLVMCGGISAALGLGTDPGQRWLHLASFQVGRVGSYTALGAILGSLLGLGVEQTPGGLALLRMLAGVLLIAMGLYVSNWWSGLLWLERGGQWLWRRLQGFTTGLLPVRHTGHALLLGASWGLLPCGLIYTALGWAATAADPFRSALLMLCFGMGTLPVMFATGAAGQQLGKLLRGRLLRNGASVLLIAFGAWTLLGATAHGPVGEHAAHQHGG